MSQETVEILRTAYAAWNAGDHRSMLDDIDPDVAWEQNLDVAGLDRVYRGHDGFLRWVQEAVGIWGQFRAEPLDFIDAGEHVVVPVRMTAEGRHSDVHAEQVFVNVFTLQEGKIVRRRNYLTLTEALKAVGLAG